MEVEEIIVDEVLNQGGIGVEPSSPLPIFDIHGKEIYREGICTQSGNIKIHFKNTNRTYRDGYLLNTILNVTKTHVNYKIVKPTRTIIIRSKVKCT